MSNELYERIKGVDFEAETIERALAGEHEAGRDALRLCSEGLMGRSLSPALADYLADRLWRIGQALDEAETLREHKKSSGSIRSARDAAIAEALCIKRPAKKPSDPLPQWQVPYAALGCFLLKRGVAPTKCKDAMSDARIRVEGHATGLHLSEASRILAIRMPAKVLPVPGGPWMHANLRRRACLIASS